MVSRRDHELVALVFAVVAGAYVDALPVGSHSMFEPERARSRGLRTREIDLDAAHKRGQGLGIDDLGGPRHYRLAEQVGLRQVLERLALDRLPAFLRQERSPHQSLPEHELPTLLLIFAVSFLLPDLASL